MTDPRPDADPSIDPDTYRAVLGSFVTGVTVVTTMDDRDGPARPFGTTVNSFTSVSLEPPLILITVGRDRSILPVLERSERWAVNILAEDGQALSDCFAGAPSAVPRGDFCGATWEPSPAGQPYLADALAHLECRTERMIEAGDHSIIVGRVTDLRTSERLGWPLLYFRRRYLRIERAATIDLRGKPDAT